MIIIFMPLHVVCLFMLYASSCYLCLIGNSNIKVCLKLVLHIFGFDLFLGVEDDIFLLDVERQEVELFLLHFVAVHNQKTVVHAGRQIIVVLDRDGLLCFHGVGLCDLFGAGLDSHEELVHVLLFFRSILHHLQMPVKQRRPPCSGSAGEGYRLHLVRRDVVHLLYLSFEVFGQIVLLFAVAERVGDEEFVLVGWTVARDASGFAVETRFEGVLDERGRLEAVHLK